MNIRITSRIRSRLAGELKNKWKTNIIGEEKSSYARHSYFAGIHAPYEKYRLYPDGDGLGDFADVLGVPEQ
jgi:hypothetical protein